MVKLLRTCRRVSLPVSFTVAMKHDHGQPIFKREIETVDGKRPYMDLLPWMATATLTGCPASVAPIMGPFWEDATSIEFAELLTKEIGVCSACRVSELVEQYALFSISAHGDRECPSLFARI